MSEDAPLAPLRNPYLNRNSKPVVNPHVLNPFANPRKSFVTPKVEPIEPVIEPIDELNTRVNTTFNLSELSEKNFKLDRLSFIKERIPNIINTLNSLFLRADSECSNFTYDVFLKNMNSINKDFGNQLSLILRCCEVLTMIDTATRADEYSSVFVDIDNISDEHAQMLFYALESKPFKPAISGNIPWDKEDIEDMNRKKYNYELSKFKKKMKRDREIENICSKLNIEDSEYLEWLKMCNDFKKTQRFNNPLTIENLSELCNSITENIQTCIEKIQDFSSYINELDVISGGRQTKRCKKRYRRTRNLKCKNIKRIYA